MNNMVSSRLGTIINLETRKGKEVMNTSEYKKDLEGTSVCMKRLAMDT